MIGFEDLGLDVTLLNAISDMGWTLPTPIQIEAVPAGLAGRDIFAQAQTGTGKTGTYALIIMARTEPGSKKPTSLVLTPTRELATQVENEIYKLSKYTGHRSISIYGGASISDQTYGLRRGADIVVGTPGRLKDMITRGALDLSEITEVVLDEADRMLDMGFADELNFIMDAVPKEKHTLLFSATMAESIKRIAFNRMQDPMEISVSRDEPVSDLVTQYWIPMSRGAKAEMLEHVVTNGSPKTVVFCQTKRMVDTLADEMSHKITVGTLHGDMPQAKRERTIRSFRNNRFQVLIATDVAARGLDINNIDLVVNFDVPMDSENYLHRIGRTGRAGKEGVAVSFVTKQEEYHIRQYERETGKRIRKVRADEMPSAGTMIVEDYVKAPAKAQRQFAAAPVQEKKKPVRPVIATTEDGKKMVVLQINLGRDDGFSKTQILDLVKRVGKLDDSFIGNVGLGRSKSFIEIREDRSDRTMETMSEYRHKRKDVLMEPAEHKSKYQENKPKKGDGQY